MHISQTKYVLELLKKYEYEKVRPLSTPKSATIKMDSDESGKPVDPTLYHGMIGSLLYLCASKPDIQFSVGLCAHFQSCPKESHLVTVKQIC